LKNTPIYWTINALFTTSTLAPGVPLVIILLCLGRIIARFEVLHGT
jgi:hypothetical protein